MTEYAAELINRCKVQERDRMTSYQRKFGKIDTLALAEFGEAVFYMPLAENPAEEKENRKQNLEPRFFAWHLLGG